MKNLKTVKSAIKSICRNPTRTFLTTLGIIIGIGAVIALMEIGNGAQVSLSQNMETMGVNNINIMPGRSTKGGVNSGAGARVNLTYKNVETIRQKAKFVSRVSPNVSVRGQIIYKNKNWNPASAINGVNTDFFEIANWKIDRGVFFTNEMVQRGAKVCLIGQTVVNELFGSEDPIGKDIRVQNVNFKVIGTLKAKGANMMGFDQDDTVIMPWTTVKARLKGAGQSSISAASVASTTSTTSTSSTSDIYTGGTTIYAPKTGASLPPVRFQNVDRISASAISTKHINDAVKEIGLILREEHGLSINEDDDFFIRTLAEFYEILNSSTKTMTNLLICVAFISLIVGGVGIMNIMLVSVTERTREIGLRMAVGAKKSDILRQFLIESVVICMVGGAIGILAGHTTSLIISKVMNWPSAISYSAIFLAVGVSVLVGVLFGYYPAWKAARLDPIEALRYE